MSSATPLDKVACRALIIHEGKLLVIKLKPEHDFYCLPGGSLERRETLEQCFEREIYEELGVKPVTGKLLFIHQGLIKKLNLHVLEFFYTINNGADFLHIDPAKASHGFEIHEIKWIDIQEDFPSLMPDFILPELRKIDWNNLENYQTKVMLSE